MALEMKSADARCNLKGNLNLPPLKVHVDTRVRESRGAVSTLFYDMSATQVGDRAKYKQARKVGEEVLCRDVARRLTAQQRSSGSGMR